MRKNLARCLDLPGPKAVRGPPGALPGGRRNRIPLLTASRHRRLS
ncbi:hypothetical protein I546_3028 [Mycobacterium kansasii 732]|nr:hypothetical protein I546_3028 [Mycobacterium kansasii 732]